MKRKNLFLSVLMGLYSCSRLAVETVLVKKVLPKIWRKMTLYLIRKKRISP